MADQNRERLLAAFADHLLRDRLADEKHGRDARATGDTAGEMRGEETTTEIRLLCVLEKRHLRLICSQQNEATLRRHA